MQKLFMLSAFAVATVLMMTADRAGADETKQDTKAAQATKDPNYRWYNGKWWYWMPKQKHWMVWNGNEWNKYDQAQANRGAVRSFSYQDEGSQQDMNYNGGAYYGQGIQRLFGTPLNRVPGNVSQTDQIIGSYGLRRASSKAIGDY